MVDCICTLSCGAAFGTCGELTNTFAWTHEIGHVACVVDRSWLIGICGSIRVELSQVEFLDLSQANHIKHIFEELFFIDQERKLWY